MDLNIKYPYALVNRAVSSFGIVLPMWQVINVGDVIISSTLIDGGLFATESIDLENGIIVLKDIKTDEKYTLTSNDDSRKFNVYWKSDNEFERKPE